MVMRGRTMQGFIWVDPLCDARSLKSWLALSVKYVSKLPPK